MGENNSGNKTISLESDTFHNFMKSWLEEDKGIKLEEIIDISCDLLELKVIVPLRHEQTIHEARMDPNVAMRNLFPAIYLQEHVEIFINSMRNNAHHLWKDLKEYRSTYKFESDIKDDSYLWKESEMEVNPYENCYIVNSKVRGHVLILNNEFAKDETMRRDGSRMDVMQLSKTFEELNYEVHEQTDLTKKEMLENLEDFVSNEMFHSDCHSGGLIVMSHGNNGVILDVKSDYVPVVDFVKIIKGKSSCLRKKPVFVIFQACRGIQEVVGSDGVNLEHFIKNTKADVRLDDEDVMVQNNTPVDLKPVDSSPYLKDLIIMYSCFPTYLARRHSSEGAIFIQALCEVIQKYGRKMPWQVLCQKIVERDNDYQMKYNLFSAIAPDYELYLSKNFYLDTAVLD